MQELGVGPQDALFIGDTTFDMEMARAADLRAVGVSWGYHEIGRLIAAGANEIANDVEELRAHVRHMLED